MASQRLFFAITPPEALQQQLVHWRAHTFSEDAGRPIAAANLHLTLAFLGDVSPETAIQLQTLASRIRQPAFDVALDDAGHWPRPGVVWLGCQRPSRGLLQLASLLRAQAARHGCGQPAQPFHPHVTLLRAATQPVALPPRGFHWQFSASEFSLFASEYVQGRTRYRTLASWPLLP
ncbi:RNA 2',3'-cyclic phosphodiesterase [Pantoea ananatis]|uniref:RNA 2',3'-cyclic phosphodiesterase n=1 Tax=Pantoea ananas TaxID=553 RepID=UPI0006A07040|nr:RNA 2',3'-cyclic phosphodiesterase [Pantoea ananatis]KNA29848.1 2'-5' RNA ligase [Pantoea ananatis]MCH9271149.1 RNA 2',3'-cyclic phosphodiesterase [Pantoea ananatis]PQK73034.1 RNA 2',3'-cyclic phosphodiesterase [Pantoea ananatis]PQK94440.1 RNA 2',3'-cyclic phosphodiesterase [Pantoea ananatis]QAB31643.1 RNA 2',3'-cyclic phosphodiesterase [Pantoea ananatis]